MKKVLYVILIVGLLSITYSVAILFFDNQNLTAYVNNNQSQAVLGAVSENSETFMGLLQKAVNVTPNYINQ